MQPFISLGFLHMLTLLFIGLKLGHVISWSWLYVFAPLYGLYITMFCVLVLFILFTILLRS